MWLVHLAAQLGADQREDLVGLGVAAEHRLREDELTVDVDVEDAVRARDHLDGADTDKALSAVREAITGSASYANSTMRVRLTRQDSLSVQAGRSELCMPRLVAAPPLAFQASMPTSQVTSVGTPRFKLLVDEEGRVIQQQLVESSGLSQLDAAAGRRASQAKYEPARLDGQAVRAWVEMPER